MQSYTVNYGTAPESILVVKGVGRLHFYGASSQEYDSKKAHHRNGKPVNVERSASFDTPSPVYLRKSGWITVRGGRNGRTITFAPDAVVPYAVVNGVVVRDITLREYVDTYC